MYQIDVLSCKTLVTGLGDDFGDIGGGCHGCSGPQDPAVYINQTKSNFSKALF